MLPAANKVGITLALTFSLAMVCGAAERWKIQYFYDQRDADLELRDIRCPSPTHCIAAGVIQDEGHERGVLVLTTDAGQHWSLINVKEHPITLFFLDESTGWMVTDRGIWTTPDGGTNWSKLDNLKGLVDVHFLDASHGFTAGFPKAVYETTDGGHKWAKVDAVETAPGEAEHTIYDSIAFQGAHGLIAGSMDPSEPTPIRRNPATGAIELKPADDTVILETQDGGKTWTTQSVRFDGKLAKLVFAGKDKVAVIVGYEGRHKEYPSAVFAAQLTGKAGETIFAQRDRAAVDFAMLPNGRALIAAIEPPGNSTEVPIPGKLKILESDDLSAWREMDVDYRAVARGAVLAAPDADHVWVATDTGMILHLVKSGSGAH